MADGGGPKFCRNRRPGARICFVPLAACDAAEPNFGVTRARSRRLGTPKLGPAASNTWRRWHRFYIPISGGRFWSNDVRAIAFVFFDPLPVWLCAPPAGERGQRCCALGCAR